MPIISWSGPEGREEAEISDRTSLGDVRIADSSVSSVHAWIYFQNDDWIFEDAESRNGSFI
ncbi:FHA domain-containing protein, partial [Verrucomicrobiota bacterium]